MPTYPQWLSCWRELGADNSRVAPDLFDILCARYSEVHRQYHTLQHLDECLAHFSNVRHLAAHPAEVELALWFHDAVYEPAQYDNEQLSADWALASANAAGAEYAAGMRIHRLILATRHHEPADCTDAKIVLDCDLAILGACPERYAEYEQQIRAEYAFVQETLFKTKRTEILQSFLDRPSIFHCDYFVEQFDAKARLNLTHAIKSLT